MQVPLLDLKTQYQTFKAELLPLLESVCDAQMFILGPQVLALEESLARYSQAPFAVGVSSGTDALLLALMALDVAPGQEVIAPPFSFFATAGTIARLGARPVFVDIDAATYNLSPAAVQGFIDSECELRTAGLVNRRTGARVTVLMPVHLYGQCADMGALLDIAKRYRLKVVEDAAQAVGSEYSDGRRAGSFGEIGCFSFFPSKNLGAFGDAGLCTARDPALAERMRVMRVHGGQPKYYHAVIGGNFRIDELQAAVLNVKLRHLDAWTAGRQRNAQVYRELFAAARLDGTVTLPHAVPGYRHIYNQFVIRAPDRDRLRAALTKAGVGTEIYYPVPLHLQQCFAYLGMKQGDCPESERAALETLAIPVYPELARAQLEYVVENIRAFYA